MSNNPFIDQRPLIPMPTLPKTLEEFHDRALAIVEELPNLDRIQVRYSLKHFYEIGIVITLKPKADSSQGEQYGSLSCVNKERLNSMFNVWEQAWMIQEANLTAFVAKQRPTDV